MPFDGETRSRWPGSAAPNFPARTATPVVGADGAALATASSVADTNTALADLKTSVDAVAALLTTQNGYLDGLEGFVDGLEAKLDALNTVIGTKSDAAWDGIAASASLIAIMKAVWTKLP